MKDNNLFSINLLNFINYRSDVECDKRVFFEALIIKYLSFNKKSFFLSKQEIRNELGIKRTRAESIIGEFTQMGLIAVKNVKSSGNLRPQQVNYFTVFPEKIPLVAQKLLLNSTDFINRIKPILKEE